MAWAIVISSLILGLAYAVPKMTMIFFQMSMVAQQIETLNGATTPDQTQFDVGGGAGMNGPYA